ncbi:MAG: diphthine--ammonia ligase [Ignisphaera sp.]
MKLCVLLSGGKDSNYALYKALKEEHEISCIIVIKPKREDSWLFHSVYPELALLQAKSMGFSDIAYLVEVSGEKDVELKELESYIIELRKSVSFNGILCGAISSRYQLNKFELIAKKIGVKLYAPLWGVDQEQYIRSLVKEGFIFIITKISTMGLPRELIAKPVTPDHIENIIRLSRKYKFNPAFEGGEAETLVIDAPHFNYRLCLEGAVKSFSEFEHLFEIKKYWLGMKNLECLSVM